MIEIRAKPKRTSYFREWERKNKERRNAYHRELYAKQKLLKIGE